MFLPHFFRLKTYYIDYAELLPESAKMYELLGLNLLYLLSQNKTSDFHTELELLPAKVVLNNPYISCPVSLEQFIMEGKYNKVGATYTRTGLKFGNYVVTPILNMIFVLHTGTLFKKPVITNK